ncbi:DNA-binding protein HEXBP-like isoform X1 [Phoenix dactylifera]|uniref:DNA-binding protein HEXBP-like isoform X1 n=1 Tax=Phoenix dactylifera TaxID=42345 RepID=A0A8B8J0S8_PHODC|nr:DNA-binding protein HEXBP-like isoform X1 [Phoenix dactylifera]
MTPFRALRGGSGGDCRENPSVDKIPVRPIIHRDYTTQNAYPDEIVPRGSISVVRERKRSAESRSRPQIHRHGGLSCPSVEVLSCPRALLSISIVFLSLQSTAAKGRALIASDLNTRDYLCNNCKRPGHYARDCPNAAVCNNCALPGHIAAEYTTKTLCWNCEEPGHVASECSNEPVCHMCNKTGHLARDCHSSRLVPFNSRLCKNCYKPGHIATDCTNDKAWNNCRKTGHLARECPNDPVCNICNVSGHVACNCPKASVASEIQGGPFCGIICHICGQPGHISRDCLGIVVCNNCGGRGHLSYECPSGRFLGDDLRRYLW